MQPQIINTLLAGTYNSSLARYILSHSTDQYLDAQRISNLSKGYMAVGDRIVFLTQFCQTSKTNAFPQFCPEHAASFDAHIMISQNSVVYYPGKLLNTWKLLGD